MVTPTTCGPAARVKSRASAGATSASLARHRDEAYLLAF
jgi:hypothetical protein